MGERMDGRMADGCIDRTIDVQKKKTQMAGWLDGWIDGQAMARQAD